MKPKNISISDREFIETYKYCVERHCPCSACKIVKKVRPNWARCDFLDRFAERAIELMTERI